jgi:hypothetical protein
LIKTIASTKFGTDMPALVRRSRARSANPPWRAPVKSPNGMAMSRPTSTPPATMLNVTGRRLAISLATRFSWKRLSPKSNWTAFPNHRPYWTR